MEVQTEKEHIVTPIKESPVYALLRRPSLIDFPGRLCRVLFVSGCNLRCIFCHNSELLHPQESTIPWTRLEEILAKSREYWVDSICITGGEPTLNPQLKELIFWLKKRSFKVKLDTNGTRPDILSDLLPHLDYVAMDYKAPLERYFSLTGCTPLEIEKIRESVRILTGWKGTYEFRTTVIEGFHSDDDIQAICRELTGGKRYAIQGFVPLHGIQPVGGLPVRRTPMSLMRKFHSLCQDHFQETIIRGA